MLPYGKTFPPEEEEVGFFSINSYPKTQSKDARVFA
jgi:hypothetical protein